MIMLHRVEINTAKILVEEITAPAIAAAREETTITETRARAVAAAGIITMDQEIITTIITGILRKGINHKK